MKKIYIIYAFWLLFNTIVYAEPCKYIYDTAHTWDNWALFEPECETTIKLPRGSRINLPDHFVLVRPADVTMMINALYGIYENEWETQAGMRCNTETNSCIIKASLLDYSIGLNSFIVTKSSYKHKDVALSITFTITEKDLSHILGEFNNLKEPQIPKDVIRNFNYFESTNYFPITLGHAICYKIVTFRSDDFDFFNLLTPVKYSIRNCRLFFH